MLCTWQITTTTAAATLLPVVPVSGSMYDEGEGESNGYCKNEALHPERR